MYRGVNIIIAYIIDNKKKYLDLLDCSKEELYKLLENKPYKK